MTSRRQMKLGAFLRPYGHHIGAWRHPAAVPDANTSIRGFIEMAQTAERGLFDLIFEADTVSAQIGNDDVLHTMSFAARLEPFTLLAALSTVTNEIGLICTFTTSYDQPYLIARRFATLDVISGGRVGWNLVTSGNLAEATNFNLDLPLPKPVRYKRAHEFANVVLDLWDSWDADAFVRDKATGTYFDKTGMHVLNHEGEFFKVRGPLNVPPSPQGRPLLVQAGASEEGIDLAAETADVVFCVQRSLAEQKDYYDKLKGRTARYGRSPDDVKIMPGITVVVAPTTGEARERQAELDELIVPEAGQALLSAFLGYDIYDAPLDGPLPPPPEREAGPYETRTDVLYSIAQRDNLTIRQLYQRVAASRGHTTVVGSPTEVADAMQETFEAEAADGFNVMPPLLPRDLDSFTELVIPELQRRGLFRTEYEGPTLREKLGLRIPENRFHQRRAKKPVPASVEPAQ